MKTTTIALALTALATFSFTAAQLVPPPQADRAAAPARYPLELGINEADVLSLMFKSGASMASGSGGGAGKASFSDLSIVFQSDKVSPLLAQKVVRGKHFPKATLFVRKAGKEPHEYYKVSMEDVTVTNHQIRASAGGDRPIESVSFNFAKIEFDYKSQK